MYTFNLLDNNNSLCGISQAPTGFHFGPLRWCWDKGDTFNLLYSNKSLRGIAQPPTGLCFCPSGWCLKEGVQICHFWFYYKFDIIVKILFVWVKRWSLNGPDTESRIFCLMFLHNHLKSLFKNESFQLTRREGQRFWLKNNSKFRMFIRWISW